ncbi:hypothetical protein GCM10010399_71580 [Dactylosporangium fulvum]|uniref:Uncharacterized protein n=1 Tax=Dactylosporangium fulvum TaxID=53359 RepID=A0ABY5VZD8_9ACTN|nr:hypothetical protein [Dactylosporangium fulvum]UWP82169.1 hypothetical protein Dfulv_45085 [Dactylosporangium fulvum]
MLVLVGAAVWVACDPAPPKDRQTETAQLPGNPPPAVASAPAEAAPAPSQVDGSGKPAVTVPGPGPGSGRPSSRAPSQPPARTTAPPTPVSAPTKPSWLPANPPGRNITASASASCGAGGWFLNVSATLVGFIDNRVIVHTANGDGSWTGSDIDGGPTAFNGPAPETGYGPLPRSQTTVTWFVWALDENADEVSSNARTTSRPACAG